MNHDTKENLKVVIALMLLFGFAVGFFVLMGLVLEGGLRI